MTKKSRQRLDKPFRLNLRALWREFKRCSEMYRPLYHDRLVMWNAEDDGPLSDDSWLLFTDANMPDEDANEWWSWEQMPAEFGIGRYSGFSEGLQEFVKIAESAAILFDEMELDIGNISHRGWLALLHEVAFSQQLPLLRCRLHPWGRSEFAIEELDELGNQWHCTQNGIREYPLHPHTFSLIHSVFLSSMTLIESVLNPDSVVITSSAVDPTFAGEFLKAPEVISDEETSVRPPELHFNFPRDKNVFKKISEKVWVVQFVEGGIEPEQGIVNEQIGFYHIQKLLSSEKQPVSYLDLYAAIPVRGIELLAPHESRSVTREFEYSEESQGRHSSGGTGSNEMVSKETITNMRKHRKGLLAKIERAKLDGDEVALVKFQADLLAAEKYLNSVSNLWGYPRQFELGTPASKACNCVKKNISVAMASLNKFEKLSAFLKISLQPQGADGRQYTKAGEVRWETT